ncbi:MAG: PAC2 family protein [Thermomicrobiales bacterium]|nr:PAC2 family protein [Thermomicrobiales bacterium]
MTQHDRGWDANAYPDVTFSARPALRDPIMIVAFEGWGDAAEAATATIEFLRDAWDAERFATIDPEEFYDFTETRPMVRLVNRYERAIDWPVNEFLSASDPARDRDVVLLLGIEPNLKWRRFTNQVVGIARELGVTTLICIGALLADVPHARPARVSVTATDETLRARLGQDANRPSRYEGPTGIMSVIQDAFTKAGIRGASIWGHAPHYLSAAPNPNVTLGILRRLETLLNLTFDLAELQEESESFIAQVNEAVAQDPEATSYIHQLETQSDEDEDEEPETFRPPHTTGKGLIHDVEEYLRRRRASDE